MEGCCPSPEYPIIQPDERALKFRQVLKCLFYGQIMVAIIKLFLFGTMTGLFQLVNVWVVYTAYATMHFCSVLIYLIMCFFDLLFMSIDWKRLMKMNKNKAGPLLYGLFGVMILYYLFAICVSYRIHAYYKILFQQQLGDMYGAQYEQDQHADQEAAY
jgi:hypothetical protein